MNNKTITMEAGNLYDANKQLVKQTCKSLTHIELAQKQEEIKEWFINKKYVMLLNHDIRYFTVFHNVNNDYGFAAAQVIGCLEDQNGDIVSIELQKDGAWEIWVKIDNDFMVFYLFDYEKGVIII